MKTIKQITSFASGIDSKKASNILPLKNAEMTYNFDFFDGSLKSGSGFWGKICPLATPSASDELSLSLQNMGQAATVFYYKRYDFDSQMYADQLIVFDENFAAYYIDLSIDTPTLVSTGISFSSKPFGTNFRLNSCDVFLMASKTDSMVVWNGSTFETIADAPKISSMAIHFERLFVSVAGDSSEVWFSDDLDPTNWNLSLYDAGFIQLMDERGPIRKVVSFNNYVYLFRDFGISRLSASSSQDNFFVSHLFVSAGKIIAESVALCGDRIIFATTDGIYQFDGSSTTEILPELTCILASNSSCACFLCGKYYLSCHVDFGDNNYDDDFASNALFVLDVTDKSYTIVRGESIVGLCSVLSQDDARVIALTKNADLPVAVVKESCGKSGSTNLKKVWRSALSDLLLPNKDKTVRKLHVISSGDATINISSEKESQSICLDSNTSSYPIFVSGRKFRFEIESLDPNVMISDLALEFYY